MLTWAALSNASMFADEYEELPAAGLSLPPPRVQLLNTDAVSSPKWFEACPFLGRGPTG